MLLLNIWFFVFFFQVKVFPKAFKTSFHLKCVFKSFETYYQLNLIVSTCQNAIYCSGPNVLEHRIFLLISYSSVNSEFASVNSFPTILNSKYWPIWLAFHFDLPFQPFLSVQSIVRHVNTIELFHQNICFLFPISCFIGAVINGDLPFQPYFPISLLFPSLLVLIFYLSSINLQTAQHF